MTGSYGNSYVVWLYANKSFFRADRRPRRASTTAPSYTSNYFVRIYVLDGLLVAGIFMGPATEACA
jgi:hypothetical protein